MQSSQLDQLLTSPEELGIDSISCHPKRGSLANSTEPQRVSDSSQISFIYLQNGHGLTQFCIVYHNSKLPLRQTRGGLSMVADDSLEFTIASYQIL